MRAPSLREIARALGGEVSRGQVNAPGPGHSRHDRSLSVRPSWQAPDGFVVFSHAGDDFGLCRDHVRDCLGLPADSWKDRPETTRRRVVLPAQPDPSDESRIERAVAIWNEGRDPRGTIVERYLASRGLALDDMVSGTVIRFHARTPWKDKATGTTLFAPCMLSAMRRICDDRFVAVHRTRLSSAGEKLGRMMLGPAAGTAIKLDADETVTTGLTIGEGIETVMSGRLLGFRPAWALGMAGGIAKLSVVSGIECLTILTERDETGANERATNECGERWHATGREVNLVDPKFGNDVNDALRGAA